MTFMEKAMAPQSSILAWKIPWTEEPGGLHAVHGVAKSRTRLSDFTFTFHFYALEREMATHSSVLAWRIPGTGEPGGLSSMGSHKVGHDWSDLAAAQWCLNYASPCICFGVPLKRTHWNRISKTQNPQGIIWGISISASFLYRNGNIFI